MLVFVAGMFVFAVGVLIVFDVLVLRMVMRDMVAQSGGVFGAFVGGVGFELGAIRGAMFFYFLGFFFAEFGFGRRLIFGGVEMGFFFLVEFGATRQSVGLRVVGSFFVFGFGEFECERGRLLIVQLGFAMRFRGGGGVGRGCYGQLQR